MFNRSVVIIAVASASIPSLAAASGCGELALTSASATRLRDADVRPLAEIFETQDPKALTDRERAIFATGLRYRTSFSPKAALELVTLGVPESVVQAMLKRDLASHLSALESARTMAARRSDAAVALRAAGGEALERFVMTHGLDVEIQHALAIDARAQPSFESDLSNVLIIAMMVNDRGLQARAFAEAMRRGKVAHLIAVAATAHDDDVLIRVGRVCVARYLVVQRSGSWLNMALRAFSEVSASRRAGFEGLLFDLHDLLTSQFSVNHAELNTKDREKNVEVHAQHAIDVLLTTLPVRQRVYDGDIVFRYTPGAEKMFVARVAEHLDEAIRRQIFTKSVARAVGHVADPRLLLEMAQKTEAFAKSLSADKMNYKIRREALHVAATAFAMSGDVTAFERFVQRTPDIFRAPERVTPVMLVPEELMARTPEPVLAKIKDWTSVSNDQWHPMEVHWMKAWLSHHDYLVDRDSQTVAAGKMMSVDGSLGDRARVIQYWLNEGRDASPERIAEMSANGWSDFHECPTGAIEWFIAARDMDGLQTLYISELNGFGSPGHAAYIALAMEWIRTGRSPFPGEGIEGPSSRK